MEKEILSELCILENKARMLKRISEIEKILLSCGAYSEHNIELQNANFDRVNVPKWERDIIFDSWNIRTKYSHILLKELNALNKKIGVVLDNENQS